MSEALTHFLDCFDTYTDARVQLRRIPDDAEAELRQWLDHCIALWDRTLEARAKLS